ncbi:MAG TPA: metal ABC transporter permease, partial [Chromatiaceae bacterium]|nr:metal ABC transporter permease [Chromatiaceae bacterium]
MLEIFQHDFMIRAFAAGTITGIIAPLIGTFLVVRRLSLMAETLAHVSLLGI